MPSRQKLKGKRGEAYVCDVLKENFGENFMRTPTSGAYVGGINVQRKEVMTRKQIEVTKSDIITPDSLPHLVIECKYGYPNFPFHQFGQDSKIKMLDEWITQLEITLDENDFGVIVFKITPRKGSFIAFPMKFESNFTLSKNKVYYDDRYIICDFEKFIEDNISEIKNLCSYK